MNQWARFWAVDLHVHTPGSEDAKEENYGSARDIVDAAIEAKLDAIAVTDHNTVSWCSAVAEAAAHTSLVVIPGVEISTTEGHLLALWEVGTDPTYIEEVLVRLGIGQADRGKLNIAAAVGLAQAAIEVEQSGGIAIAAHIEKDKGLLKLAVKAHLKRTLVTEAISAFEVVHMDTIEAVNNVIAGERMMAFVRGSDTWDRAKSCHGLVGIGARRTWIKASRPDLVGIRHAFDDPELRVRLDMPPEPTYTRIESIEIAGGFLGGETIAFAPDLNCLLGGTGAGKSLVLEAIRFALDQQVDARAFPAIRGEIDSRMTKALMTSSVVVLHIVSDGKRYRVERTFNGTGSSPAKVFQETRNDWVEVDLDIAGLCPLAAFSQGEILDYSREPVGRMTLIDSSIDLEPINTSIAQATAALEANGSKLIAARARVRRLEGESAEVADLSEQVRKLEALFTTEAVKEQSNWTQEQTSISRAKQRVDAAAVELIDLPDAALVASVAANADLFTAGSTALTALKSRVDAATREIADALGTASAALTAVQTQWELRFETFKRQLDAELEKIDPAASLTSLRGNLEQLQARLSNAQAAKAELVEQAKPDLADLESQREQLIQALTRARTERRELRRARVAELNSKTAGFVKLDIPAAGDTTEFREALDRIKIGSRVREDVLNQLATRVHPLRFGRSLWKEDIADIVDPENGIDMASVAKLLGNIDEKGLWQDLLDLQAIDRPDVLTVKFKKPDTHSYTHIEELAHGQRCTAILVILLADGITPVLVDQPEDALHAPWIEEYLVDRLRSLRGSRQYVFATRSPGIVVSGDAEQIVTMKATAGHGEVEAAGSLERHELNNLALNHLEGGRIPFKRRTSKLKASVNPPLG